MFPSENELLSRSKIVFVEIFCIILGIVDELLVKRIEFVRLDERSMKGDKI